VSFVTIFIAQERVTRRTKDHKEHDALKNKVWIDKSSRHQLSNAGD